MRVGSGAGDPEDGDVSCASRSGIRAGESFGWKRVKPPGDPDAGVGGRGPAGSGRVRLRPSAASSLQIRREVAPVLPPEARAWSSLDPSGSSGTWRRRNGTRSAPGCFPPSPSRRSAPRTHNVAHGDEDDLAEDADVGGAGVVDEELVPLHLGGGGGADEKLSATGGRLTARSCPRPAPAPGYRGYDRPLIAPILPRPAPRRANRPRPSMGLGGERQPVAPCRGNEEAVGRVPMKPSRQRIGFHRDLVTHRDGLRG